MANLITRVQNMLVEAGFEDSTIALAAAKSGDFEIMGMLLDSSGPDVFVTRHYGMRSAYEYAASANRVDVMRWLLEKEVLPDLATHVEYDQYLTGDRPYVQCPIAFIAAAAGAFEALEYIADHVPKLREMPIRVADISVAQEVIRRGKVCRETYQVVTTQVYDQKITYTGLLVTCALAARCNDLGDAAIIERLREHLKAGGEHCWMDLDIALRFDRCDLATILMEAGAKIDLPNLLERLQAYRHPTSALDAISSHVEQSGKGYQDICAPIIINEPDRNLVPVNSFEELLSARNGFPSVVNQSIRAVKKIEEDVRSEYRNVPRDVDALPKELVRFLGNLDARFVGPTMLVSAMQIYHPPILEALLERGVDPNEYQLAELKDSGNLVEYSPFVKLAVHACYSPHLLRLLTRYGADVNLPMRGEAEKNLLYLICTSKHHEQDMLYAFAECGGDFARKFEGKTAASLAKKKSPEFHGHLMAAKTSISVTKSLDSQVDGVASKPSRSPKMSPL